MKEGFEKIQLKDACNVFADGDWIERKDQSSEGIRLVQTGNIGFGFFKDKKDKSRYISEETFNRLNCTEIVPGDLLVSRLPDPVGKSCIIPEINSKMITGVDCTIIRPKDNLSSEFLGYYQMSHQYLNDVQANVSGATRQRISRKKLGLIEIPLPSLPQQKEIVGVLDKAFAIIDIAKANAEQNLQNAKELFESYLQNIFENKGDDWEEMTLGEVCSLYQGLAINAKTKHALVEKSNLPLLRIKDLKNNTEVKFIDPNNYPANALVSEEDIIYTRTGSLGLVFRGRKGVLHNNSFKVVPNDSLSKDFLFIWLQNPIFQSKIMSLAQKAAQPDITHKIFKIQKINIPPLAEQKIIVNKIDALSTETKKLEAIYTQKIADLEEMKKSVLQKAFSGQLKTLN